MNLNTVVTEIVVASTSTACESNLTPATFITTQLRDLKVFVVHLERPPKWERKDSGTIHFVTSNGVPNIPLAVQLARGIFEESQKIFPLGWGSEAHQLKTSEMPVGAFQVEIRPLGPSTLSACSLEAVKHVNEAAGKPSMIPIRVLGESEAHQ